MEKHFKISPLEPNKLVKVNDLQQVSNPVFFNKTAPTPDGLLSNTIFGISKDERAGKFAYIDLHEWFINPLHYKILCKLNGKIRQIVHGTDYFKITDAGEIVKDADGDTGLPFLKKNFDKIKFERNDSKQRDDNITFIENNKDTMFINKFIVIPAYYRDVNTDGGRVGVGEINKLYSSLIVAVRAIEESIDYGLNLSDATRGRIQELCVSIYDWFGAGTTIGGEETSKRLPGKFGVIRRGNLSKTADYSSRLILSAPQLKVESLDDMMADMDHCALPLYSALVNFYPYILFYCRRFFDEEFAGKSTYTFTDNGEVTEVPITEYQIAFSDKVIDEQIRRYLHGYSNRLIPIELPVDRTKVDKKYKNRPAYMYMKGKSISHEEFAKLKEKDSIELGKELEESSNISTRPMTWCDLFFQAAVEVTKDKMVLITRYPIDSFYNQYPIGVRISSTVETEPLLLSMHGTNTLYKWYPKIRKKDINSNTSNMFIDTLQLANPMVKPMGGDYDGDQVTVKPVYTIEATQECKEFINKPINFVNLGANPVRPLEGEGNAAMYAFTLKHELTDENIFTDPIF